MFFWLSLLVILVLSQVVWTRADRQRIVDHPRMSFGWIIRYDDGKGSVEGANRTITYAYIIDSVKYERSISTASRLSACKNEMDSLCSSMKFIVLCDKRDPANSVINLTEINTNVDTSEYVINYVDKTGYVINLGDTPVHVINFNQFQ
jgi:hypothetical protein